MRGQLSLEALLLFTIFLSILAVALAASSQIRGMAQRNLDRSLATQAFDDFSEKLGRACALGNGNVRIFSSQIGKVSLARINATAIEFAIGENAYPADIPCEIKDGFPRSADSLTIENADGAIRLS